MNMQKIWCIRYEFWSLPVVVEAYTTSVLLVRIAQISLLKKQETALTDFLTRNCFRHTEEGFWFEQATLEAYGEEVDGDPEDCVRWLPQLFRTEEREDKEMEGFYESFAATGWFNTPKACEVIFRAFCKHMLYWLVCRKVVNLGFCKLMPLPYRQNWKETVLAEQMKGCIIRRPRKLKIKFQNSQEGAPLLMTGKVLAVTNLNSKPILWTLECVATSWWYRATLESESRRARKSSTPLKRRKFAGSRYWVEVRRKLWEARPHAKAAYLAYLSQISHPTLSNSENVLLGRVTSGRSGRPLAKSNLYLPIPRTDGFQVVRNKKIIDEHGGVTIDLPEEAEPLPPMSDLQPPMDDLRNSTGAGLLLSDAFESEGSGI